ncbi:PaaX family transcriptional regulator [Microbacterium halotolerans]|uniref:PaaX family transcriptional regulator n=1 Tax=Microbacterium halotolerans TaxID=246613 RepID=UPI000E6ADFE3|nr:PaaX family transcriptional regulator [Microbacterium halotolerans]
MTSRVSPRTLIEALLPSGRETGLSSIYDTANRLGIQDQPLRLALRRLIATGEITQRGRGRAGTIRLTEAGRERLERDRLGLHLAFAQDAGYAPWKGTWHLLSVSAPESERSVRDSFRRVVLELGAVPVSTGLYLTPHDLSQFVPSGAAPYLLTATASTLSLHGLNDPRAIAESLWPAEPTVLAYRELAAAMREESGPADPLLRQLFLAEALDQALRDDPLLPPELRPAHWPPAEVRREWLRRWQEAASSAPELQVYEGWLTAAPDA